MIVTHWIGPEALDRLVAERGPRYVVQGKVRAADPYFAGYAVSVEQAEAEAAEMTGRGMYQVRIIAPVEVEEEHRPRLRDAGAAYRAAQSAATDAYQRALATTVAAVRAGMPVGEACLAGGVARTAVELAMHPAVTS